MPGELALQLMGLDQVLDPHVQFGRGKRLGQKVVGAGRKRRQLGLLVRPRRQQDDRDVLCGGALPDFAAGLQAVLFRHHHVEENDLGYELRGFFYRLLAVHRFNHVVMAVEL